MIKKFNNKQETAKEFIIVLNDPLLT